MAQVTVEGLSKRYDAQVAVEGLDLAVADGEFVTLLGPSGCGKTTTLRMVAGFIAPTAGRIAIGSRLVSDAARGLLVPPNERRIGMVFQSYAVWPHMTVLDNVGYPLKVRKVPNDERRRRVRAMLEQVKLGGLEGRYPHQLSGGQQQRVALARALVMEPQVLLLDEPLSNLDAKLREEMRDELKVLQRQVGVTILFVTHDQLEAMTLSDRVVIMHQGVVQQVGTPQDVYERPTNRFVASFVGAANLLPARLAPDGGSVEIPGVPGVRVALGAAGAARSGEWWVLVRPEAVELAAPNGAPAEVRARVSRGVYVGDTREYVLQDCAGLLPPLRARVPAAVSFAPGDEVAVRFRALRAVES